MFTPAKGWSYVGGAIVIEAEGFRDCQRIIDEENPSKYSEPELFGKEDDLPDHRVDCWVLEAVRKDESISEEGLLINNYNYA